MGLAAGTRLGHYEILEPLGAGGMGEVFRAHDAKLDRDVALKVLPEGALGDEEARKRFRREAHALSRLSHPHIATILDFDTQDGTDYLAMELVRGHSLRDELETRGPLPEKTVVRLGAQIAHGLQAAHEQGVVHRDLKPSNLQLTPDGLVKILDFGLARLVAPGPGDADDTAPTETAVGRAAGTLPYMSPEQLRGRGVDARTDLYALGAVLYELATGRRLFSKDSAAELTEAILNEGPKAPRAVNERLTPGLEVVILKALDKDPELRHQTAKDLLVDLERLQQRPDSASSGSGPVTRLKSVFRFDSWRRVGMVMGLAALLLAAAAAWLLWPPQPPRVTNVRPLTGGLDTTPDITVAWPSWATDGVRLYCLASKGGEPALFQIPATGGETVAGPLPFRYRNAIHGYLPGESALLMSGDDISQEWSWAESVPLWVVPVPAGAPSRVGNFVGWAAAASPDGRRVAAVNVKDGTITVARRDGSIERVLGPFPIHTARSLTWSPDGRRIRYTAPGPESSSSWIWETTLDGGTPRPLWRGSSGRWSGDGRHFLFQRWNDDEHRSDLHAVREDYPSWVRTPEPVRLTSGPMSFSVPGTSPDGRRLFAFGTSSQAEVVRWEPATRRFEPYLGGFSARAVDASRDGGWVAWVSHPEGTLWRSRSDGTDRLRLTGSGWAPSLPRWSPDGRSLVFIASNTPEESRGSLYLIPRDGGRPELLVRSDTGDDNPWDPCWLPDGTAVLFSYIQRDHAGLYRVDRTTKQVSLLPGSEQFTFPKCSPRGDLLALQRPPSSSEAPGAYWVFRADRNSWEPVPDLHAGQFHNWSPDGGYIISLDPGTQRLTRWSRTTGDVEVFADVSGIRLLRTIALPWTGFAHDGAPLVIRDLSTRDLYALDWEAP